MLDLLTVEELKKAVEELEQSYSSLLEVNNTSENQLDKALSGLEEIEHLCIIALGNLGIGEHITTVRLVKAIAEHSQPDWIPF